MSTLSGRLPENCYGEITVPESGRGILGCRRRLLYMNNKTVGQHVLWQRAIQSDDVKSVEALLKDHDYLPMQCVQRFRVDGTWFLLDPLCEAAHRNCIPVCELLLASGKNPNSDTTGLAEYRGTQVRGRMLDTNYLLKWTPHGIWFLLFLSGCCTARASSPPGQECSSAEPRH